MNIINVYKKLIIIIFIMIVIEGCTSVNTYPTLARSGDTVTFLIGGSEDARKETTDVTLTDANGTVWDLKAMGLVRSVFNIRIDAKSIGHNYSSYIEQFTSWAYGHEMLQTILIVDLPSALPVGDAVIEINTNVSDNMALLTEGPFNVSLEIVSGVGTSNDFSYKSSLSGIFTADLSRLESAPYAKIDFGPYSDFSTLIGAVSLVIDFDELVVNPDDINVYVPESNVRGTLAATDGFGDHQRMVYWHHKNGKIYIDIISPQGLNPGYLKIYLVHPENISGVANISIMSNKIYDINGELISLLPELKYHP